MEAVHSSGHNAVTLITTHRVDVPELTGQRRHFVIIADTKRREKWAVMKEESEQGGYIVSRKDVSNYDLIWLTTCWYPLQAEWAVDAAEWWWENWSWSQMLSCRRRGWEGAPLSGSRGEVPLAGAAWCGGPQRWESPWCHRSGCGRDYSHHTCTCW